MKEYTVQKPFMARVGQFSPTDHVLCIGIEKNALSKTDYRCYIGKNKEDYYDMSHAKALEIVAKYGEKNVLWTIRGKVTFILPINEFNHGKN